MRTLELPDRHLMGDDVAQAFIRKPAVQMKGRRLDLERGLAQFGEIEIDRVIWRRTDRCGHTGKQG